MNDWRLEAYCEDHGIERFTRLSRCYQSAIWTDRDGVKRTHPGIEARAHFLCGRTKTIITSQDNLSYSRA